MIEWIDQELQTMDLGDQRLNARAVQLLGRMMSQPNASLPGACHSWAETQAAYRFFTNGKVSSEKVLSPHKSAVKARMAGHDTVLCIQDTTEVDYSGKKDIEGLGKLSWETRQGLLIHPTLAVTPNRLCLGVLDHLIWSRDKQEHGKAKDCGKKEIEEKESYRWIEGYRAVCAASREMPQTRCVYIADRESDIYELFLEGQAQSHAADYLVRAAYDRLLEEEGSLSEALLTAPELGEIEFELPPSHKRKNKPVVQALKAVRVKLASPRRHEDKEGVEVTVILAQERKPLKGEEPITWLLVSNRLITTKEDAIETLQWYVCRWQIEVYFRILKSGCKIEELQLEHADRLRPALALYMIVAWRVLYLTVLGRECPDIPCDVIFETKEWHAIYTVSEKKQPPAKPPTLSEMLRMTAQLGGFPGRKSDGEPGPKTVWIGLQRARDFVLALDAYKAAQAPDTCV